MLVLMPTIDTNQPIVWILVVLAIAGFKVFTWVKDDQKRKRELEQTRLRERQEEIQRSITGVRETAVDWEARAKVKMETIRELEDQISSKDKTIGRLLSEKESWIEEQVILQNKIKEKSKEILDVKAEFEGLNRRMEAVEKLK